MSEEILDIVDENDNVIGSDTRYNIHKSRSWHRGIHVIVLNSKGEMLLQLRSPNQDKYPGTYDLSVSEHAKSGESYERAAERGLLEELGIRGGKPEKLLHIRMEYGPHDRSITVLFKLVYDGFIKHDKKETVTFGFMPIYVVKKMLKEHEEKFAFWACQILRWYFGLDSKVKELKRVNEPL